MRAMVLGIEGTALTAGERAFLQDVPVAGVILFARNIQDRAQLRALTDAVRAASSPHRPLLCVDQEGGRVMRLRPPVWPALPAMGRIGALARDRLEDARRAASAVGRMIGAELAEAGIDVACAPCLDVAAPGLTEAIGDRSFGADPDAVALLGRAVADGLLAEGVLPVIKHLPGHGRATVDSHLGLPHVDAGLAELEAVDFAPFRALADLPVGMTAHLLFPALDPELPATLSPRIIQEVIRGRIGFDGLLFSDDLGMGALSGSLAARATASLAAGCDLALACSGKLEDAWALAEAVPALDSAGAGRYARALAARVPAADHDLVAEEGFLRSLALVA